MSKDKRAEIVKALAALRADIARSYDEATQFKPVVSGKSS